MAKNSVGTKPSKPKDTKEPRWKKLTKEQLRVLLKVAQESSTTDSFSISALVAFLSTGALIEGKLSVLSEEDLHAAHYLHKMGLIHLWEDNCAALTRNGEQVVDNYNITGNAVFIVR